MTLPLIRNTWKQESLFLWLTERVVRIRVRRKGGRGGGEEGGGGGGGGGGGRNIEIHDKGYLTYPQVRRHNGNSPSVNVPCIHLNVELARL